MGMWEGFFFVHCFKQLKIKDGHHTALIFRAIPWTPFKMRLLHGALIHILPQHSELKDFRPS